MKRFIMLSGLFLLAVALFANGEQEESLEGRTLSIMTFTGEFKDQGIVKDFEELSGVKVELQIIPLENYEAKIRPLLKTGRNVPDLFVGEAAYVKEFVEAGFWEPLNKAPYKAKTNDYFDYANQMATDKDGNVRALTWQMTPGGWFYRRSLAKEYFGTDDPEEIAKLFKDWDTVLETAETLKRESGGRVKMFPGIGETQFRIFYSARKKPWINKKNEMVIDSQMLDYIKIAKTIRDKGYDAKLGDWTGPWFEAMNTPPGEAEVFVYGWPTWGLHFVMSSQENSLGDWAVAAPPAPFCWGGTWVGIYKDSPNKDAGWAFIKMLTQNEEYMEMYARRSGDFLSNKSVMDKLMTDASSDVLAGQNHYEFFYSQARYVDGSAIVGEDYSLNSIFGALLNEYLDGQFTYNEAVVELKQRIKAAYPNVTEK